MGTCKLELCSFLRDVRAVWTNAIFYNGKDSEVGGHAANGGRRFEEMWRHEFGLLPPPEVVHLGLLLSSETATVAVRLQEEALATDGSREYCHLCLADEPVRCTALHIVASLRSRRRIAVRNECVSGIVLVRWYCAHDVERQDMALIVCSNVDKIVDGQPKCRECGERRTAAVIAIAWVRALCAAVCESCFTNYGWNWEEASADENWECCHCKQTCPGAPALPYYRRPPVVMITVFHGSRTKIRRTRLREGLRRQVASGWLQSGGL